MFQRPKHYEGLEYRAISRATTIIEHLLRQNMFLFLLPVSFAGEQGRPCVKGPDLHDSSAEGDSYRRQVPEIFRDPSTDPKKRTPCDGRIAPCL
jgi:hypothetical protein